MPAQVRVAVAPVPEADRTTEPAPSVTRALQRVAPVAVMTSLVLSRTPSPLGEMSVVLAEAEAIVGDTVSMVTA